jgi:excisionase family DNA binding protein
MTKLLTSEELAVVLRLRPATIRKWAREGKIPTIRMGNKVRRFDPDEVVDRLRKRQREKVLPR